jgi:transposase
MIPLSWRREDLMKRFVEVVDRGQSTLFPERLDDWVGEDNPVRVIDVFVDELDLGGLGFGGVEPQAADRPAYHPSVLLKLYIYGNLNRVQSSRRLERETGRNVEVMWLMGRLAPDHKTIADFRKDNGRAAIHSKGSWGMLRRAVAPGRPAARPLVSDSWGKKLSDFYTLPRFGFCRSCWRLPCTRRPTAM